MAASNTTQSAKTIFWFDDGKRPNVADSLDKIKDITLHRLNFKGPEADNWGAMAASHAYCITSTRQEVPEQYHARAPLLARCPDLLAVSTSGAGYDTVDVPACTAAGVLVVNQSGGNADAVAEHAVGMMLSLTKNIPQTDRSLRTERGVKRVLDGYGRGSEKLPVYKMPHLRGWAVAGGLAVLIAMTTSSAQAGPSASRPTAPRRFTSCVLRRATSSWARTPT